jgi:uncharacterized protein Usg
MMFFDSDTPTMDELFLHFWNVVLDDAIHVAVVTFFRLINAKVRNFEDTIVVKMAWSVRCFIVI